MKHSLSVLALTAPIILCMNTAYAASFGPLVSPEDLAAQRDAVNPLILDIRGDAYKAGHIDGAVSAPYSLFRGPADNPGQILDEDTLEERFEALGLKTDAPIVIAPAGKTDTDFGAAARVYWTLKSTGFTDLSILNGGVVAWEAAGLPVENEATVLAPTELDITFSDQWTADTEQVLAATRNEIDALLIDARTEAFYEGRQGHRIAAKPGTLPGAELYTYSNFFDNGSPAISEVTDPASLRSQLGITDGQDVVSFCNTGHWAATHWFALSELAGVENAKLYPGSMVEYSNAGHEMENAPGRLRHFFNQIVGG